MKITTVLWGFKTDAEEVILVQHRCPTRLNSWSDSEHKVFLWLLLLQKWLLMLHRNWKSYHGRSFCSMKHISSMSGFKIWMWACSFRRDLDGVMYRVYSKWWKKSVKHSLFQRKKKKKFFVWKDKFWVYYFYSNCSCVWHVFLSSRVHHYGEMGRKLKGAGVKLRELWCNFLLRLSEKAFNSVFENKGRAANAFFPLNFCCCCSDCQKIICLSCSCNFE